MATLHPLVARAREFATTTLRPQAGGFDADQGVPREVLAAMAEHGFLGAILPVEYGGGGMDALNWGLLTHEIGKGCSSARALLTVHSSLVGETLVRLANPEQKRHWLPQLASGSKLACFALTEPDVGSDATACKTSFRKVDGGYVINGRKKWITYGAIADVMLLFANSDNSDSTAHSANGANGTGAGAAGADSAASKGGSAFLLERGMPGLSTTPMRGLLASRGAHLAEIELNNVFVPEANLLGREGAGFSFVANTALFFGRYSIAWAGVSIAEAALEEMVTYAGQREQFGQKLRQHQLVRGMIADAVAAVHLSRALCEKVGRMRDEKDDDAVTEANIAKYVSSKAAMEVAQNAVQLFGGNGISSQYPVERLFREAKVLEIIEGSSQIQQMMLSDYAVRRYRLRSKAARNAA